MPSMRAVLEARRKAAAVRVEELEAELDWVRTDLADAEEVLRCRVIGLEQYLEALAEEEAPAVVVGGPRKPVGPTRGAASGERGRGRGSVGGLPGGDGCRDGGRSRRAGCAADGGGARLGQRVRLPGRGGESTSETAGETGLAVGGEAGKVHAASIGTGP